MVDRLLGESLSFQRPNMRRCRFMTVSHSFEAVGQNRIVSGPGFVSTLEPRGSAFWLQAMMGPRFEAPYMTTGKHGGQPTTTFFSDANIAAQLAEAKAKKINTVFAIGIVNDAISTKANSDALIAIFTKAAKAFTEAGIYFIVSDDLPAGAGSGGTNYTRSVDQLQTLGRIQRFLMDELPLLSPLVIPIPIYHKFVDPAGTTGVPADPTCFDGIDMMHPNVKGHFLYALEIFKVLDKLFPPQPMLLGNADNAMLYGAALNPRGSLITNPMLSGDVSGKATSWTINAGPAGITSTFSKLTDPDGTPVQQISVVGTATAAGGSQTMTRNATTTQFLQGDKHQAEAYILVKKSDAATGYINLRGVKLQATAARLTAPTGNFTGEAGNFLAGQPWPDFDWSQFNGGRGLYFRTLEEEVGQWDGSLLSQLTISAQLEAAVATDFIMQVRRTGWRKTFSAAGL